MTGNTADKYSSKLEERREWYKEHAEEERARARAYGAAHREEKREAVKKCYYAKQEYYLEKRRQYVEANHEKIIMKKRLVRIKERSNKEVAAHPELTETQRKEMYDSIVDKLCAERGVVLAECC